MDVRSLHRSRVLAQFEKLIHRTLARAQVSQQHMFYDDYAQELRLKLLEIERNFDGQALGADRIRFVAFAGRGLYWQLISLLRKEKRVLPSENVADLLDYGAGELVCTAPGETASTGMLVFIEEARRILTGDEFELFLLLCDGTWSMVELAEYYGVGRQTMYKRKEKLARKLEKLKGLLLR